MYKGNIQPFYFLVLWPVPLVLFAWFLWVLAGEKKFLAGMLFGLFIASQIIQLWYFYPLTYTIQIDHKNLLQDFSFIQKQANLQTFNVINDFTDINLFHYYLNLTGVGREITPVLADKLIVLCLPQNFSFCPLKAPDYSMQTSIPYNGLLITIYKKIPG
jgi:hypothetical protein